MFNQGRTSLVPKHASAFQPIAYILSALILKTRVICVPNNTFSDLR